MIGKTARRVARDRALDCVAGITLCNEGTIRDWIRHGRFNVTPNLDTQIEIPVQRPQFGTLPPRQSRFEPRQQRQRPRQ